jgi:mono/diheme cytochrome c family protein
MISRGLLPLGAFVAGLLLSLISVGADAADAQLAERGEAIFQQKCSSCHTIGGGDLPMGPDLADVTQRREHDWLAAFILDPGKMIAANDPVAVQLKQRFNDFTMPSMGISDQELEALLAYLASPAEVQHHAAPEVPPAVTPAAEAAATGDPRRGEALFVGTAFFANGGAPCLACHGIAGAGLGKAAGASFGPDLTALWENFGEDGVLSVLESLPFPSMTPIYANRPLNHQEQLDLAAFLAEVDGRPAPQIRGRLAGDVLLAGAVFLGLIGLFGWRRLHGVRRPLVKNAHQGKGK